MTVRERTPVQVELAALLAQGWTLANIARHLDMRRSAVDRWWGGTRNPRFEGLIIRALVDLRDVEPPPRYVRKGASNGK